MPKELTLDISVKDKNSGEEIFYRYYANGKAIIKD
jgi:hypothetical protein